MSEWIKVKDRAPTLEEWKQLGTVLTRCRSGDYRISGFSPRAFERKGTGFWFDVTHWMPIPELPEEGTQ